MLAKHALVGLTLTLLFRGTASTIAAAVLAAFAVVPLVRSRPVLSSATLVALMPLVRGIQVVLGLAVWCVALLLLASVVVVARDRANPPDG